MGEDRHHAQGTLNVSFKYSGSIARGDLVEIGALRTVGPITSNPAINVPGVVAAIETEVGRCTVETPFRGHRYNRIAGEDVDPGLFVVGPGGLAYQYAPAAPARHDGTAVGPVDVTENVDDAVTVTIDGTSQTIALTADTEVTMAAIAAELNAALNGILAEVDAAGNVNLVATETGKAFSVDPVDNDAYGILGLAEGTTAATAATVTGTEVEPFAPGTGASDALKIKVGAGDSQDFTLAETDTTAIRVAAKINATADGFSAAAVNGAVKLTVDDNLNSLEVEAVANDAYTVLGLTAAVTQPTAATVVGTAVEPFAPVAHESDILEIAIGGGATQRFVLAETDVTAALVAAKLAATAVGFTASDSGGSLSIAADDAADDIEVQAVTSDAYTLLGWTVGTYYPTNPRHDPWAVRGLILVGGDAGDEIETLEW